MDTALPNAVAQRVLGLGFVLGISVWIAFSSGVTGDYSSDAAPAVRAMSDGNVAAFLSAHPDMGPVSILLRAPFAALGGSGELAVYHWGSLPCVLAAGLLGLYLARLSARRGAGILARVVLVGPISWLQQDPDPPPPFRLILFAAYWSLLALGIHYLLSRKTARE